jgi:putative ABC transport system substrate-binding protein
MSGMRRRDFITLLGGVTVGWPLAAGAQQPTRKIIKLGFLQAFRNENTVAFLQGLRSAGYTDGQNALVEARFSGQCPTEPGEVANELVSLQCDVIMATGPHAIQAAMSATSVLPIAGVNLESDPVAKGWATSLARPGKNLTGWFLDLPEFMMRPRFADSIKASSPSGLREQAGHMTASDFCTARSIFFCQAGAIHT